MLDHQTAEGFVQGKYRPLLRTATAVDELLARLGEIPPSPGPRA